MERLIWTFRVYLRAMKSFSFLKQMLINLPIINIFSCNLLYKSFIIRILWILSFMVIGQPEEQIGSLDYIAPISAHIDNFYFLTNEYEDQSTYFFAFFISSLNFKNEGSLRKRWSFFDKMIQFFSFYSQICLGNYWDL